MAPGLNPPPEFPKDCVWPIGTTCGAGAIFVTTARFASVAGGIRLEIALGPSLLWRVGSRAGAPWATRGFRIWSSVTRTEARPTFCPLTKVVRDTAVTARTLFAYV